MYSLITLSDISGSCVKIIVLNPSAVNLIELRIAKGMCGKSYMTLTGEVAAVTAAIESAKEQLKDKGTFLDSSIIARPSEKLWKSIV